jgi:hypothetical protein
MATIHIQARRWRRRWHRSFLYDIDSPTPAAKQRRCTCKDKKYDSALHVTTCSLVFLSFPTKVIALQCIQYKEPLSKAVVAIGAEVLFASGTQGGVAIGITGITSKVGPFVDEGVWILTSANFEPCVSSISVYRTTSTSCRTLTIFVVPAFLNDSSCGSPTE